MYKCIYSCIITSSELEQLFFFSFLLMFLSFFLTASNMKLQKTNQFSKLPSSGYGQRSLTTSKLKANSQVSSSCSAPVHKPGKNIITYIYTDVSKILE